jgi:hypothetical protein
MALRSKLLAWSIALSVALCLVAAPVHADPLTDSFTGKRGGSHRPAKKSTKPGKPSKRRPSYGTKRPARPAARPAPVRSSGRPPAADDDFAEASEAPAPKAPPPRREPPEDRPKPRRSADAEEQPEESSFDQGTEGGEEEETPKARRSPPPSRRPPPPKVVAKKKVKKADDEEEEEGEGDGKDEEEEEDEGSAFTSLPVIIPHMVSLGLGGAIMGRSFQFAAPAQLQKESSFPRLGLVIGVEAFPFLAASGEWWRQFGLGISYAAEPSGQASVTSSSTGMSVNTPVKQSRWGLDVRYVIAIGDHVVLTPGVGLLSSSFTLETKMPVSASNCPSNSTAACLPDTNALMFAGSGNLKIALAPEIALSLSGMYLLGLSVKNKPLNQIGYESATSAGGFQAEAALSYLVTDWLALRGGIPITRVNYQFHTASVAYKSASETYYGLMAQAVFLIY